MLRLLHTADVLLGARHEDLGEAAPALRERAHAALAAAVDVALAERVGAFLVAGNLFDANTAARRTVERAAAEFGRLAAARIRVVLLPGTQDAYTRSSVYRAHDLAAMAGGDMLTVLTPGRPWVHLDSLDALVVGAFGEGQPFAGLAAQALPAATWRIGMAHGGFGDRTGAVPPAALEQAGLDYAALAGDRDAATGQIGTTTWSVPGAPDDASVERDTPGTVNLVALDVKPAGKAVTVEPRPVGRTRRRAAQMDMAGVASQASLVEAVRATADPDLVLDLRLVGVQPDDLDLDLAALEAALRGAYLAVRVTVESRPALSSGPLPPPETITGAFIRRLEDRILDRESTGKLADAEEGAELREVLRLGRRLLEGAEVAL